LTHSVIPDRPPSADGEQKTSFSRAARVKRIHSPKPSAPDQDSLIFARCIDYSGCYAEINHPVLFESDRGFCKS
jgi:hypothetical protein